MHVVLLILASMLLCASMPLWPHQWMNYERKDWCALTNGRYCRWKSEILRRRAPRPA